MLIFADLESKSCNRAYRGNENDRFLKRYETTWALYVFPGPPAEFDIDKTSLIYALHLKF